MEFANGIYFGMPFEEYETIERLSKSRIKRLMISPADFWVDSWLNPNPPKLTPEQENQRFKARLLGKAYHCARLEPDAFPERFARAPTQADFAGVEGFLHNATQIEAELVKLDQPKKSKDNDGVLGQARRLADAGYKHPIWHIEKAKADEARGDRIAIDADKWDQIIIDMERLAKVPSVHALLSDGAPEVSILYTCPDTGLPMKARLDWLRGDGWVEFKSFSNIQGKVLEQCLIDAVRFNRYYIDLACYHEAVEQVRLGNLPVQGGDGGLVAEIMAQRMPLHSSIVFQQKDGVPNVLSRDVRLFEIPPSSMLAHAGATEAQIAHGDAETIRPTMLMMKARAQIRRAKAAFVAYSEIYPSGEPWLPWEPHGTIGDIDFHPNWLETL